MYVKHDLSGKVQEHSYLPQLNCTKKNMMKINSENY